MAGSYLTIAETANYKWQINENHSNAYRTYSFLVVRKKDGKEIEPRPHGDCDDELFKEFDVAYDELEKESHQKNQYQELTEEQVTLAEMWHRMKVAEDKLESYKKSYEKLKNLFDKIYEIKNKGV